MKLHFVFVGAIFLSGCKINLPNYLEAITNSPAEQEKNTFSGGLHNRLSPNQEPIDLAPDLAALAQEQSDVWQRIALQLEIPIVENERIIYYRNWYLKNPLHLQTVAKRAEPFLYLITEQIEQAGIPLEIALLPIVESAFDQFAYSHGSAAGLWQFIPETGLRFGLEQNWWYDGRRDVLASTKAAIDLLTYLNKKFDGDWLHALAAYNSGEGRVFRAIKQNKAKGLPTDFWSLSLPEETSGYVPKLLALADVIKNKEKYNISIPPIANEPTLEQINPEVQMDLAIAANYAELSLNTVQNLNPGYNHWATSPEGPFQLLLPKENLDAFNRNFLKNNKQGINVIRYKVQSGDTLGHIAQRNNTTVKVIQTANNLEKMTIREGKYLLIPVAMKDPSQYLLSSTQRIAKVANTKRGDYRLNHAVSEGDSFWVLARKYDVSIKSLARWNSMSPKDPLRIGQNLVVWKKGEEGARMRTIVYQIRDGDVLSTIAARHNVTLSDIILWNALKKNAYIKPGQKLTLHVDVNKVSA